MLPAFLPAVLRSFRLQLALACAAGVLLAVGLTAVVLGGMAARAALHEQSDTLQTLARSTAAVLADGLAERQREVELLAASTRDADERRWQPLLDRLQATRPHFSWVGLAGPDGSVRAASSGRLIGRSVAERPWFQAALTGPHTGDVHAAKLLAAMLPPALDGAAPRFLDFAAPLRDARGEAVAVLGVHVSWDWAHDVIGRLRSPQARAAGVRVFIIDRQGSVIHRPLDVASATRPAALADGAEPAVLDWDDGGRYLTASARLPAHAETTDLGWTVVTRQPVAQALAGVREVQQATLGVGLAAAMLACLGAWWMAGRLSRPLRRVAAAARALRAGQLDTPMPRLAGSTEVLELTAALSEMTSARIGHERALESANRLLEERVAARTAELERTGQALQAANAELQRLASHDALTGLPNRRSLDETLHAELQRHRRHGRPLAIAMADVDHFKRVNDEHGHAAGDEVLRRVARALVTAGRASDVVGRLGGEEFLILMPETGPEGAAVACEKLRAQVAAAGGPVHVTMSFGLVCPVHEFSDAAQAMAAADAALYRAKSAGRNRVCVHPGPEAVATVD